MTQNSTMYTSNAYLVTGTWNTLDDVNTLVDTGRNPAVYAMIDQASTGVGKKRIEQIVLTHSHYDHASLVPEMKKRYGCRVMAFTGSLDEVDVQLHGGENLTLGDRVFQVLHVPLHSNDSIVLVNEQDAVVFSGDTNMQGCKPGDKGIQELQPVFRQILRRHGLTVYPGHGPVYEMARQRVKATTVRCTRGQGGKAA